MSREQIAMSWAKALFQVASTREDKLRFMHYLTELEKSSELQKIITDPRVELKVKEAILTRIFHTGSDVAFLRCLLLLVQKGRFGELPIIRKVYNCLTRRHLGQRQALVIEATASDPKRLEPLKEKLDADLQAQVLIDTEVNSDLRGGMILSLDNHLFDGSVKGKLKRLKEKLMNVSITEVKTCH